MATGTRVPSDLRVGRTVGPQRYGWSGEREGVSRRGFNGGYREAILQVQMTGCGR